MDWNIIESSYEKYNPPSDIKEITVQSGIDTLKQVDSTEENGYTVREFKVEKETELFEIELSWEFIPENDEEDSLEAADFKQKAAFIIMTEGSHIIDFYLKNMGYNPMPGILTDPEYVGDVELDGEQN